MPYQNSQHPCKRSGKESEITAVQSITARFQIPREYMYIYLHARMFIFHI